MTGFFSPSVLESTRAPSSLLPACGVCGLYKTCKSPKLPYSGKGKRGILILGEAPTKESDIQGEHFSSAVKSILSAALNKFGVDLERDCWTTNALICAPGRDVDDKEITYCRPNLTKTLKELNPTVIIPLGGGAVKSLLSEIWDDNSGYAITKWAGWKIPCQELNTWICPNYHPSYLAYMEHPVLDKYFERYLREAVAFTERPWDRVLDLRKYVRIIYDEDEAVSYIKQFINIEKPVAFDFETESLKPDSEEVEIVCCSMSDGKTTVAFPWFRSVIDWFIKFLRSTTPKVGANNKFETRWVLAKYGFVVRNWVVEGIGDTMITAHLLDCRPGITGLKFQAFVNFGQPLYNTGVERFLKAPTSNEKNNIRQAPLDKLLMYCGLDSLLEWMLAREQQTQFGD